VTERTYEIGGLLTAYLAYLTYRELDSELGDYHRSRYAAFKAAFGVDVDAPLKTDAWSHARIFADFFHSAARRYVEASTPFDGVMEAPRAVYEAIAEHERRLRGLQNATRAELLSLMSTTFSAAWGDDHPPVTESALKTHGFDGGAEPDPVDFW
jgi:hypothetical protein